ncbi:rhomboid family intramembrane serine protease [Fortiea sp. LEGE XX443]|uniref:rhomboid family intramembrane serine protease n=1 Tax=Fortiea sp. LEGE XX443 TaxID=1828611 RepID=UPI00188189B0|nr:rhomboid family intramembrane serine protease [Fortiea sp. LEGE XX443]MBE9005197.1 rhomboid family intramembrane serine protease [Fortiea sp. LEGE XX443]
MIPISDRLHNNRSKPMINYWLIGINIAIFLWELQLEQSSQLGNFVYSWGLIPGQITAAITNAIFGNPAAWIVVFWRSLSLVLNLFIHASFSQILGNLLFLWVFGKSVENFLGHRRYLGLYLAAGILTGVMQVMAEPNLMVPLVGANGAIAAILAAYVIKFPQSKIDTVLPLLLIYIPMELPATFYLFWWFIQQIFYGIGSLDIPPFGSNSPSLAYWMQIVGLLIGVAYIKLKR